METSIGPLLLILSLMLIVFLLSGMHIAFAMLAVGTIAFYVFLPRTVTGDISRQAWIGVNNYSLTAVCLYIFMGEIIFKGGIGDTVYDSLEKLLNSLPGSLLHSVIIFCALFAAVSGSSVATAATIGTVAVPIIKKRGYDVKMMYGAMAAGGTLGILIPPSVVLLLYGALTGESVAKCFLGGMIPGIMLSSFFMIYIIIKVLLSPSLAPKLKEKVTLREMLIAPKGLMPVVLLAIIILGGIYLGIFTPTESAAVGCVATFGIIFLRGRMTWGLIITSMRATLYTTSMIFMVIGSAAVVSYVVSYLRIPAQLAEYVTSLGLSRYYVLAFVCFAYLIMGCFIEGMCMVILTVPILFPVMMALSFDPVWFGVILTICVEMGLITPPVGMNLYVLKGVDRDSDFGDIIAGSWPYVAIMLLMIIVLTIYPRIVTWLPDMLGAGL